MSLVSNGERDSRQDPPIPQPLTHIDQQELSSHFIRTLLESSTDAICIKDCDGKFLLVNAAAAQICGLPAESIIGRTDDDIFPPDIARLCSQSDRQVLETATAASIEETIPVDGQMRTFLTTKTPCFDKDKNVIGVVGIARDITVRKATERELEKAKERLEQQAEKKRRELQTAKRILGEDVMRLDALTKELKASEERFRGIAEGLPMPIAITRISDGVFLYVNNRLAQDFGGTTDDLIGQSSDQFYKYASDWERLLQLLDHDGLVRDYELRARRRNGSIVWLSASLQRTKFDGEDAVLIGFLDVTQRKIARDSLEREHRKVQRSLHLHARDRQVLAYEIHDGIVQDLTGAMMHLQSIEIKQKRGRELLDKSIDLLQGSIHEARRLINGLRPPVLEERGIVAAIEDLIDEIKTTSGLETDFTHDVHFDRIAPALEVAIYRTVQEGLNNVWQHSKQLRASVQLQQEGSQIHLRVEDDGVGFEIDEVKSRSYGLRGIRERAKLLGGRAEITASKGNGTKIAVKLPMAESGPEADDSWGG